MTGEQTTHWDGCAAVHPVCRARAMDDIRLLLAEGRPNRALADLERFAADYPQVDVTDLRAQIMRVLDEDKERMRCLEN